MRVVWLCIIALAASTVAVGWEVVRLAWLDRQPGGTHVPFRLTKEPAPRAGELIGRQRRATGVTARPIPRIIA